MQRPAHGPLPRWSLRLTRRHGAYSPACRSTFCRAYSRSVRTMLMNAANVEGFRQRLRELGYVEGSGFIIEYRSADGIDERFSSLASELVRLRPDVIVTGGTPAAIAARNATNRGAPAGCATGSGPRADVRCGQRAARRCAADYAHKIFQSANPDSQSPRSDDPGIASAPCRSRHQLTRPAATRSIRWRVSPHALFPMSSPLAVTRFMRSRSPPVPRAGPRATPGAAGSPARRACRR